LILPQNQVILPQNRLILSQNQVILPLKPYIRFREPGPLRAGKKNAGRARRTEHSAGNARPAAGFVFF
jgi:hypothetical protein